MFEFIKNKIEVLRRLYETYRKQVESRKRIQEYADYITKQCAYEMKKYGHIHDGNLSSTFVGVIYNDWLSRINAEIKKKNNE